MFVLIAVTDLEEADSVPNSTVEDAANSDRSAHWLAVRGLEAFAHDDDGINLIYKDEEVGSVTVESALRVGMGTLEDVSEAQSTAAAIESNDDEDDGSSSDKQESDGAQ